MKFSSLPLGETSFPKTSSLLAAHKYSMVVETTAVIHVIPPHAPIRGGLHEMSLIVSDV